MSFESVADYGQPSENFPSKSILDAGLCEVEPVVPVAGRAVFDGAAYSRVPMDILVKWPDTIFDGHFSIGDQYVPVSPVSSLGRLKSKEPWLLIRGAIENQPFCIASTDRFICSLLQKSDLGIASLPAHSDDAALVLDLLFEDVILKVQEKAGFRIEITDISPIDQLPQYAWLCLEVGEGDFRYDVGIALGSIAVSGLKDLVTDCSAPNERQVSDQLMVKVGPIALPYFDSKRISAGDVVDTGIDPSGEVYGVLERSDGQYWPVLIDDDSVTVIDGLQKPGSGQVGQGTILASIQIGIVEMNAAQRIRVSKADRIAMNRIDDNGAKLFLGNRQHGVGALDVNDGNLVISMSGIGAGL